MERRTARAQQRAGFKPSKPLRRQEEKQSATPPSKSQLKFLRQPRHSAAPSRFGAMYALVKKWVDRRSDKAPSGFRSEVQLRSAALQLAEKIENTPHRPEVEARLQTALAYCSPIHGRPARMEHRPADPAAQERQQKVVQAAVDEFARQRKDAPDREPTGAIADLLQFAKTGRPFENDKGFAGGPRNRLGDQRFANPLAVTRFLVEQTDLIGQLDSKAAEPILKRHAELIQADEESRARSAAL